MSDKLIHTAHKSEKQTPDVSVHLDHTEIPQDRDDDFGVWLAEHYGSMSKKEATRTEGTENDSD